MKRRKAREFWIVIFPNGMEVVTNQTAVTHLKQCAYEMFFVREVLPKQRSKR